MSKQEVATQNTASNLPATVAEELAALQARIAAPAGNRIKVLNSGKFHIPGIGEVEAPLNVVIVDFAARNDLYEGTFNKSNPSPPVCAAWGFKNNDDLVPDEASTKPQADDCRSCPMNQFGSAGKGKACKNTRLVAVLPPDAKDDDPILTISVSPTGIKKFDSFVQQIALKLQNVPRAFEVEMFTIPAGNSDARTAAFGNPKPLKPEVFAAICERHAEARGIVSAPARFE